MSPSYPGFKFRSAERKKGTHIYSDGRRQVPGQGAETEDRKREQCQRRGMVAGGAAAAARVPACSLGTATGSCVALSK